ncbi:MAG TPA: hypothetical protein VLH79_08175 [Chthonomonadales bacterium]|nr:hypothetical protein [Chthonomonadales bacterium]
MNRRSLSWLAAAVACGAALWAVVRSQAPERPDPLEVCSGNVKRINLAVLLYAQDHGERYPPATGWDNLVEPYLIGPRDETVWRCPVARSALGYAMNSAVALAPWARFTEMHRTVSILESDTDRRYATGDARALPALPRHAGADVVGFADGHVRPVARADLLRMRWSP